MNGTSSIYPDAQIGNLGSDAQSLHITHRIHRRLLLPPPAGSQVPPVTSSSRQLSHLPSTPSTYTRAFLQSTLHTAVGRKKRQKNPKTFQNALIHAAPLMKTHQWFPTSLGEKPIPTRWLQGHVALQPHHRPQPCWLSPPRPQSSSVPSRPWHTLSPLPAKPSTRLPFGPPKGLGFHSAPPKRSPLGVPELFLHTHPNLPSLTPRLQSASWTPAFVTLAWFPVHTQHLSWWLTWSRCSELFMREAGRTAAQESLPEAPPRHTRQQAPRVLCFLTCLSTLNPGPGPPACLQTMVTSSATKPIKHAFRAQLLDLRDRREVTPKPPPQVLLRPPLEG